MSRKQRRDFKFRKADVLRIMQDVDDDNACLGQLPLIVGWMMDKGLDIAPDDISVTEGACSIGGNCGHLRMVLQVGYFDEKLPWRARLGVSDEEHFDRCQNCEIMAYFPLERDSINDLLGFLEDAYAGKDSIREIADNVEHSYVEFK